MPLSVRQHRQGQRETVWRPCIPRKIIAHLHEKHHQFLNCCIPALRELVALTGMNERLVRLEIQRERKAGKLILSNNRDGYFLPERPEDVRRFARSMSRRATEIASIARAAESALADMTGQECLEGWT